MGQETHTSYSIKWKRESVCAYVPGPEQQSHLKKYFVLEQSESSE